MMHISYIQEAKKGRHRKVDSNMAYRSKEETLQELLSTEERYVSILTTFRSVSNLYSLIPLGVLVLSLACVCLLLIPFPGSNFK